MTRARTTRYRVVVRLPLLLPTTWAALAALGSCRSPGAAALPRDSGGCTPSHTAPSAASVASASASSAAQATSSVSLPYEAERGCAGDLDDTEPAETQLAHMGQACVRGFTRVDGIALQAGETGAEQGTLRLRALACVRLGIASEVRGGAVEATLTAPDGSQIAQGRGRTPLLVGRDGPVCVRDAGEYRVVVRPVGAPAGLRLGVWVTAKQAEN